MTTPATDVGGVPAVDPRHEHAWAQLQFELVDGHPFVRQRCERCGLVRRYRAWERYWDPGVPADETGRLTVTDRPGARS